MSGMVGRSLCLLCVVSATYSNSAPCKSVFCLADEGAGRGTKDSLGRLGADGSECELCLYV